ncbi:MAG: HAD hydrolase family protein [Bacteriovoracaceae bacterium]
MFYCDRDLDLREISKPFHSKLKKIKVALFDVDGILTNGKVYWSGEEVGFNRFFHVRDGYGMKILKAAGLHVGIITGGDSVGVSKRMQGLGLDIVHMGNEDKREAFDHVCSATGCSDEEVLYMGDEFFDLPLLKRAGFSATVPNASMEIREGVDYVTHFGAGEGCAREVMDMLRYAQGIVPDIEH